MRGPTSSPQECASNDSSESSLSSELARLLRSFALALRAENISDKTVQIYTDAVLRLERFRLARGMPEVATMSAEHLRLRTLDQRLAFPSGKRQLPGTTPPQQRLSASCIS